MKIVKSNGQYSIYNKIEINDLLEPKVYVLKNFKGQVWLEDTNNFVFPKKLYDVDQDFRKIVLKSYKNSEGNTGVLLKGYKGQGKTITAKLLAQETKLPVIIINASIELGTDFIGFLNTIEQEYVLFIDEFEKIFRTESNSYSDDDEIIPGAQERYHTQDSFLSFMDGSISNEYKKLIILTTNTRINDKFINRPSRIKWNKSYQFMSKDLYDLIVEDKLENKDFKEDLYKNLPLQESSIDLLSSIITQINILGIPYSEFKGFFNHKESKISYDLSYKFKKEDEFKLLGEINLTSEPIRETNYIDGLNIHELKFNNEEIVFTSTNIHSYLYEDPKISDKIKGGKKIIYRIKKSDSEMKKYAF